MVGPHGAFEAGFMVDAKHPGKIRRAIVVERLAKMIARAFHVAEMDEEDFLLAAPLTRERADILTHEFEIGLAEGDAVNRTRCDVEHAAIVGGAGQNSSDTAQRRDGRIVGMQRQVHARALGNRYDRLQEVLEITPDLFFAHLAPFGEALLLRCLVIELADERAAALGYVDTSAIPTETSHPVVAENPETGLAERLNRGDVVLDLLVAPGESQLDLFRWNRMTLDSGNHQTGMREIGLYLFDRLEIAVARYAGEGARYPDDGVRDADLGGQPNLVILVRREQFGELDASLAARRRRALRRDPTVFLRRGEGGNAAR